MSFPEEREIPLRAASMQLSRDHSEIVPMHPDDFEAHLAWITAKQFAEKMLEEKFAEKPMYSWIVG